ncbi:MAG: ATPase RavA [Methanocella sp. PtaU1.Bin125]|nr:MAG: ATPase RavA [Methanocella sp. PtaU1.Bin125]
MQEEIARARSALERTFKERSDEIICSLLATCAGEHVLFLGPPGTAKSQLARSVCEAVDGNFFYYLMTRFTTPEEVFGPLSLKALQEDDFRRKIDGYLPAAHVAFLDEIFKSSSSILNSFLTILNERKFHNGREAIDVPLIAAFGASNELPDAEDNLEALYDRFLLRCVVSPIQDEDNFREMLFEDGVQGKGGVRLTVDQIREVQSNAQAVGIDDNVQRIILRARKELAQKGIVVSDRRWKKIVNVLRVAAAAAGRSRVDRSMAILLKHMAWDRPEQREYVRSLLVDLIISGGESLEKLARDAGDLHRLLLRETDRPFPYQVRCYDCNEVLGSSRILATHEKEHPGHRFFDPHRTSLSLRYMGYDHLLSVLKDEYRWDFVYNPAGKKREYQMEYRSLKERYETIAGTMAREMGQLTRQLADNVWVSDRDSSDILRQYEAQIRRTGRIGEVIRSIEIMLDRVSD